MTELRLAGGSEFVAHGELARLLQRAIARPGAAWCSPLKPTHFVLPVEFAGFDADGACHIDLGEMAAMD